MRDDDHRHAFVGQRAHHAQHVAHQLGVERRGGLVEQHGLGLHGQCARNGHALLLAARQLRGPGLRLFGQADLGQQRERFVAGLRGRALLHEDGAFHHVLQHREVREQVEALEHHAHAAAQPVDGGRGAVDALAEGAHLAAFVRLQPVDATKHRRLARARRADEAHHLARIHVQAHALQHAVRAEVLFESADVDHGFFFPAAKRFSSRRRPHTSGRLMSR
ncbi:hypothetical protein D9M72_384180 [compost metagenome]